MKSSKLAIGGLGLVTLGAVVLGMGKKQQMNRDALTPNEFELDARHKVLFYASHEIGPQDPKKYWLDVLPEHEGFSGEWCGGFTLWALHQAGLAKDINWEVGKGFCYRLPITMEPMPGDIAYFHKPFQHHAIVESVDGNSVTTIDGNQPGNTVARRLRPRESVTAFYSIEPLISGTLNA